MRSKKAPAVKQSESIYNGPAPSAELADSVDHPSHYNAHPSGVEAITVCEHFSFSVGNAIKYLWRAGLKSVNPIEDLRKARRYLDFEIDRLERLAKGRG